MKKLLLGVSLTLGFWSLSHAQCSVEVNDSLLSTYDYILNADNETGTGPFTYSWTVTDGNGIPVPYTVNPGGDSVTIDAATLQNNYGCVIYQLCMTDMVGCTTCSSDTAALQVPFPCFSQFTSSIVGHSPIPDSKSICDLDRWKWARTGNALHGSRNNCYLYSWGFQSFQ